VQPALVFSLLLLAPTLAFAQPASPAESAPLIGPPTPGGLTADQVARRAAETSHDVRARAEEHAAAEATLSQAQAAFIPRLSGTARYSRLSSIEPPTLGNLVVSPTAGPVTPGTPLLSVPVSFPVILDQYVGQATLQVPLSDYLWRLPRIASAAHDNARAAALLQEATRLAAATDGRVSYYGWARARLQATVAERALLQARAHLKDVTTASATGTASKADVLRVESQVASAELLVERAHSATTILAARLRTLMHDSATASYELGEDLREVATPSPLLARPEPSLVDEALTRRLEPRALAETVRGLEAQASATRAAGLPRLDAVGNALYARPNPRIFPQEARFRGSWDVSLQLSFTPTDLFTTEAANTGIRARARQVEAQRAALCDAITLEVAQNREALAEAEAALQTAARGLAAAEESYRVRRALFQAGRSTSVELTDAETERSRAQLEAISARLDHRIAEARLLHATGADVAGK
jgi:outer membrane protein